MKLKRRAGYFEEVQREIGLSSVISSEEAIRSHRSVIRGDSKRTSGFFL